MTVATDAMTRDCAEAAGAPVKLVIVDLDGTLLDTESLCLEVAKSVVARHGKHLTVEVAAASLGKRPLEAWETVAEMLGIDQSAHELFEESEKILIEKWPQAPLLPGALRLVSHLKASSVPVALCTSTSRASLQRKLSAKKGMLEAFVMTCCGDEVTNGKPAPDGFLQLAEAMGVPPSACLVIEDAPSGVEAATAAGMRVVTVPSVHDHNCYPAPNPSQRSGCVSLLPSLLEFRPESYGLPPFHDFVGETIPLAPVWLLKGMVVKGFGRGSRELGIPTANLDPESLQGQLAEAVTGIYGGWASVGDSGAVYKMAMSIGWNPVFANKEKTAEPWILHDFGPGACFLGQEIRLVVCAYIRPEANFESLQALIDRIHKDADVTREALEQPPYLDLKEDPFLQPAST